MARAARMPGRAAAPEVPTHKQAMAGAAEGKLDDAFLRWSEVEAIRAAGTFDFHSHTHSHTAGTASWPIRRRAMPRWPTI